MVRTIQKLEVFSLNKYPFRKLSGIEVSFSKAEHVKLIKN